MVITSGRYSQDNRKQLRKIEQILQDNQSDSEMPGMLSAVERLALPRITHVVLTEDTLSVALEDGRTISVPIGWYPRLARGTPEERFHFQISGAGYGIHWPEMDEDIGVGGLLPGRKSTESPASFQRWLQERKQKGKL